MTPVFPINNYNNDNKAPVQSIGSLGDAQSRGSSQAALGFPHVQQAAIVSKTDPFPHARCHFGGLIRCSL